MNRAFERLRLHVAVGTRTAEDGFTIIETVIAITILFASMVALAYTATVGFKSIAFARERDTGNGIANQIMEQIRGYPYSYIQAGLSSSNLTGDSNIVSCATVYYFQSCTGEPIISTTGLATRTWINPHTGTIAASATTNNIAYNWATYITNSNTTTNAYRVTLIVSWASAAYPSYANSSITFQSLFNSPSGCVSSSTHPYAAPCQPFFYGTATVPPGTIDISGTISGLTFSSGSLSLTGADSDVQNEQVTDAHSKYTESGVAITDGGGTRTDGGNITTTSAADNDPNNPGAAYQQSAGASGVGGNVVSPVGGGSTQIQLQAPTGDTALAQSAVSAGGANVCPPPTDTAETDSLPCSGSRIQQGAGGSG